MGLNIGSMTLRTTFKTPDQSRVLRRRGVGLHKDRFTNSSLSIKVSYPQGLQSHASTIDLTVYRTYRPKAPRSPNEICSDSIGLNRVQIYRTTYKSLGTSLHNPPLFRCACQSLGLFFQIFCVPPPPFQVSGLPFFVISQRKFQRSPNNRRRTTLWRC